MLLNFVFLIPGLISAAPPEYLIGGAILTSAFIGFPIRDSLRRGTFPSGWMKFFAFTNLIVIILVSFHTCASSGTFCLPGAEKGQLWVGLLGTLGFFASMLAVILLPISALFLSSFAFGWLYWIATGQKRTG